jgi:hypothetical protein
MLLIYFGIAGMVYPRGTIPALLSFNCVFLSWRSMAHRHTCIARAILRHTPFLKINRIVLIATHVHDKAKASFEKQVQRILR